MRYAIILAVLVPLSGCFAESGTGCKKSHEEFPAGGGVYKFCDYEFRFDISTSQLVVQHAGSANLQWKQLEVRADGVLHAALNRSATANDVGGQTIWFGQSDWGTIRQDQFIGLCGPIKQIALADAAWQFDVPHVNMQLESC